MFNLAIVRAGEGDVAGAIDLYGEVLAVDPNDAKAHLNLGFMLLDAGRRRHGLDELEAAVELDPSLASRISDDLPIG